jgi:hypothetical protein
LRRSFILMLIAISVWAAPAQAGPSSSWEEVGAQWARVNACDSGSHTVGVRASQAGDIDGRRMYTRFSYQWRSVRTGAWQTIAGAGSGWLDAGPGLWVARQTGWNQTFAPAPPGTSFKIRGVVEMQWRKGGGVKRSTSLATGACELR